MRVIAAAAAFLMALVASAPIATADPPPDVRPVLRLTITTGSDDLRGGRDNVMGSVRIGDTWTTPRNLNRGTRWADRTTRTVDINLPTTMRARDIQELRLETTFTGGIGGDNWNMNSMRAQLCLPPSDYCIDVGRSGFKRFTGDDRTLLIPLALPISDDLNK